MSKNFILGAIYRSLTNTNFNNHYKHYLKSVAKDKKSMVITGDINYDLMKINLNKQISDYKLICESFLLKQMITFPQQE